MSTIRIKRSGVNGNPAVLAQGELAYSYLPDGGYLFNGGDRLYIGTGNEVNGNAANHTAVGGKFFTDMLDHNKGVLTASSAIVTNAANKIDTIKISNFTIGDVDGGVDFNTIQATNLDGNVVLRPNGLGYVQIDTHGQLIIPVGTIGQRGTGHQGAIRFNTDQTTFEGYNGTNWASLGGVRSVDNKAYIIAEASPGAGDDILQFWSGASGTSSQVGTWSNTLGLAVLGNIASTDTATGSLVVTGGVGISGDLHVGGSINIADLYTADVSATQVVYGGSDGKLQGTSTFTFNDTTGTLSVSSEFDVGSLVLANNSVSTTGGTGSVTLNASGGYSWTFNTDGTTEFPNYTFPSAHGTLGQVLVDDGNGSLSWSEPASYFAVDAQSGGPQTFNLLTDTLSTVSGNTNITTSIAKNGTTVETSVTLADTLSNLIEVDVGDLILSGHTVATSGDTGNVEIVAHTTHGDQTWTFDGSGILTLPVADNGIGGEIVFPSITSGTQATINYNNDTPGGAFELINTDGTNSVYIGLNLDGNSVAFSTTSASNGTNYWNFNSNGTTTLPNFTEDGTNYNTLANQYGEKTWISTDGGQLLLGGTENRIIIDDTNTSNAVWISTGDATLTNGVPGNSSGGYNWKFDGDGTTSFPSDTLETSSDNDFLIKTNGKTWTFAQSDGSLSSTMFKAGQGTAYNGSSGYTFYSDSSFDTGMFSTADGYVQLAANGVNIAQYSASPTQDAKWVFAKPVTFGSSVAGTGGYTLPTADGSNQYALTTNGSGIVSWTAVVNSLTAGTNLNTTSDATTGNVTVNLDTTLTGLVEVDVGSLVISDNEIAGASGIGDVVIETSDGSVNYTWTFGTDGNASFPGQIKNLNDPTDPQDAATKYYVDHVAAGLHVHAPAMAATTDTLAAITGGTVTYNNGTAGVGATLTLSTPLTILDNYTLHANDRILVKNEATASYNGIYSWATGGTVLTRAVDFNNTQEVGGGDFLFVQEGTQYGSTGWVQTNTTTAIGVSDITFSQFSGQGTFLAGDGIKLTGNVFSVDLETNSGLTVATHKLQVASSIAGDGLTYTGGVLNVVGTSNRISVSSNAVDISSNYIGQSSITTVGTVTTGTWHGDTVAEAYGGTGKTSYTTGDLLTGNNSGGLSILGIGLPGQVLRVNSAGTEVEYADLDGGTY